LKYSSNKKLIVFELKSAQIKKRGDNMKKEMKKLNGQRAFETLKQYIHESAMNTKEALHDMSIISLAFEDVLRSTEISGLTWENINGVGEGNDRKNNYSITCIPSKNPLKKERVISLKTLDLLRKYFSASKDDISRIKILNIGVSPVDQIKNYTFFVNNNNRELLFNAWNRKMRKVLEEAEIEIDHRRSIVNFFNVSHLIERMEKLQ